MAVTGEAELIANLTKHEKTEEKKARKATRDGAKVFQEKLKETILMEDTKLMQLKINMKTEELNVNLMEKLLTLRQ